MVGVPSVDQWLQIDATYLFLSSHHGDYAGLQG